MVSVLKKSLFLRQFMMSVLCIIFIVIGFLVSSYSSIYFMIAFILGGFYKAKEGVLETIEHKTLNVEILMIIAALGAAFVGHYEDGAVLILIFSVSGVLETYANEKSTRSLSSLMKIKPTTARRILTDEKEKEVEVVDLNIGDVVRIYAGERVPVDGIIVKGISTIDESMITGESEPQRRHQDSAVFAGTVNLTGTLDIEQTKASNEGVIDRIIQLVQEAFDRKPQTQRFIERFEVVYVYSVLIFALLFFLIKLYVVHGAFDQTLYQTMVILVVASPCAVVASVMPATLSAVSNGTKKGILFKGGQSIETFEKIELLAVDKTGTLTQGTPKVTSIYHTSLVETPFVLELMHAIEQKSTHPLAYAITEYCKEKTQRTLQLTDVQELAGKGIEACYESVMYYVGSYRFMEQNMSEDSKALNQSMISTDEVFQQRIVMEQQSGKSCVYLGNRKEILAIFTIEDEVRSEVYELIPKLKRQGLEIAILSGDQRSVVERVAKELDISKYQGNCLPEDKIQFIENERKHAIVAMIGDGINDAPALASADVAISMGSGTDVAGEVAQIILMNNDFNNILYSQKLSKKHNTIVRLNLIFSLSVIFTLLMLNFFIKIPLPLAVFGHEGSTILVILNGLRLLIPLKIK